MNKNNKLEREKQNKKIHKTTNNLGITNTMMNTDKRRAGFIKGCGLLK